MSFLFVQFLTGLASASSLFLVASGLTLIFGVTRVVNFSHGSLYMLGAYIGYTLAAVLTPALDGAAGFWLAVLGAAGAVAVAGAVIEMGILRRLYGAPELLQLLATFGLLLVIADATLAIWGPADLLGPRAPGLTGAVYVFGAAVPKYDLFLIAVGPAVLLLLWLLVARTRFGVLIRAATEDRVLVGALGVDQARLFTAVFALGAGLAGLAGALQLPREPANLGMDLEIVVDAFVVTVVGGLGSIAGAFVAAVLIGQLHAFGILVFPQITIVLVFLFMAVVLILRPSGLFGRAETGPAPRGRASEGAWRPLSPGMRLCVAGGAAVLSALPLLLGAYELSVATEILIFALFAASLHHLIGVGGMISFGHAAYFGLGAYGAALAVRWLAAPLVAAVAAAVALAAAGAALFGAFCVRLSGVYLAMLTLAFAQICYAIAFQWYDVTGGDNGLIGIWPPDWVGTAARFYWLTLGAAAVGLWGLRHAALAPFGYGLRACRDSGLRAEALGIDCRRQRWLAFVVAGAAAGLAGGLHAFFKGSVFPGVLGVGTSVDGLVMMLLGGVDSLAGPIVGAAVYKTMQIWLSAATDYWRAILGCTIVALVLLFPRGLAGAAARLAR